MYLLFLFYYILEFHPYLEAGFEGVTCKFDSNAPRVTPHKKGH